MSDEFQEGDEMRHRAISTAAYLQNGEMEGESWLLNDIGDSSMMEDLYISSIQSQENILSNLNCTVDSLNYSENYFLNSTSPEDSLFHLSEYASMENPDIHVDKFVEPAYGSVINNENSKLFNDLDDINLESLPVDEPFLWYDEDFVDKDAVKITVDGMQAAVSNNTGEIGISSHATNTSSQTVIDWYESTSSAVSAQCYASNQLRSVSAVENSFTTIFAAADAYKLAAGVDTFSAYSAYDRVAGAEIRPIAAQKARKYNSIACTEKTARKLSVDIALVGSPLTPTLKRGGSTATMPRSRSASVGSSRLRSSTAAHTISIADDVIPESDSQSITTPVLCSTLPIPADLKPNTDLTELTKKEKRMASNRKAATKYRQKRLSQQTALQEDYDRVCQENNDLKEKNNDLKEENNDLKEERDRWQQEFNSTMGLLKGHREFCNQHHRQFRQPTGRVFGPCAADPQTK